MPRADKKGPARALGAESVFNAGGTFDVVCSSDAATSRC